MRVKILRNLGRNLPRYVEGQVLDGRAEDLLMLVQKGLAEEITTQAKPTPIAEAVDSAVVKGVSEFVPKKTRVVKNEQ